MAKVLWHMNARIYALYRELGYQMALAKQEGRLLDWEELWDRFQRLPGYPSHDPDTDTVVPYIGPGEDPYLDAIIGALPPGARDN